MSVPTRPLSIVMLALALAGPAHASDLALKRVMLSSAGVGYFEYAAEADGPVSIGLDVPLDQVDDVLKSLVVFDSAGGVGGLELPGRDQNHAAFGDVPFGPDALASPLQFLNSLQGVDVTVQGPRPMTGRILQAEPTQETTTGRDGAPRTSSRTRVSVLTSEGLRQFVLEDADAVQVTDPDLRERIGRALAALRHESGQDARHITIRDAGTGHRAIRVGYVAVAPLWKASYRLVLPPRDADPATAKARMQGWATLENASGTDWNGVALSLQYGNPVTFHQAIYRSYFVARPEVPVEVLGRLLPDVDTRARDEGSEDAAKSVPSGMAMAAAAPPPMAAPAPMAQARRMAIAAPAQDMAVAEGTEETVFALPAPVTLAAGHSASVPIIDRDVPADRIALVPHDQPHPLASVTITNTAGASFPAGVLTLYDTNGEAPYAGDARLGGLPTGERRLLSFAQDLRTSVEWKHATGLSISTLTAAAGVLRFDERERELVTVTVTAPAGEPRHVLLEVPKAADQTVAADFTRPSEETATAWRFPVMLKPGETRPVRIALDRVRRQATSLLADPATIARLLNEQGLSDAARAAFGRLADLRAAEAAREAERDRLKAQLEGVTRDEARLRDNLKAVSEGDALHGRLTRQLDADETRIGQLSEAVDQADQAVARAHQALVDGVTALKI